MTEWLSTTDDLEDYWASAGEEAEYGDLELLLISARQQCERFAPALAEGQDVPERYRQAQALQARALWRSQKAGSGNTIGGDEYGVTVFPMDWTVKALLRPPGKPVVG